MAVGDLELARLSLDVPDGYGRLTDERVEIVEGILEVDVASVERILSSTTTPRDSEDGITFADTAKLAYDYVAINGLPNRRLDAMWFKEAGAGGGAVVRFQGTVRRVG